MPEYHWLSGQTISFLHKLEGHEVYWVTHSVYCVLFLTFSYYFIGCWICCWICCSTENNPDNHFLHKRNYDWSGFFSSLVDDKSANQRKYVLWRTAWDENWRQIPVYPNMGLVNFVAVQSTPMKRIVKYLLGKVLGF